jgi:hypothetical protein
MVAHQEGSSVTGVVAAVRPDPLWAAAATLAQATRAVVARELEYVAHLPPAGSGGGGGGEGIRAAIQTGGGVLRFALVWQIDKQTA